MLVRCTSESSGNLWISPESVFLTVCRDTLAYSMCSGSRMASMYQATSRSSARKRSDKRCVRTNSLVRSSRARMNPEGSAFSATSTAFRLLQFRAHCVRELQNPPFSQMLKINIALLRHM